MFDNFLFFTGQYYSSWPHSVRNRICRKLTHIYGNNMHGIHQRRKEKMSAPLIENQQLAYHICHAHLQSAAEVLQTICTT